MGDGMQIFWDMAPRNILRAAIRIRNDDINEGKKSLFQHTAN